jgi:hypothetical protein
VRLCALIGLGRVEVLSLQLAKQAEERPIAKVLLPL